MSVTLVNDRSVMVHLDSASTSAEVCQAVAHEIGLKDIYGFSLYISLYEKVGTPLCRVSLPSLRDFTEPVRVIVCADVVSEQLWETRDGRGVSVRAGDEEAGHGGEGQPLEPLHPQGNIRPVAQLLAGRRQHRAHLQAAHQGNQVWRLHH